MESSPSIEDLTKSVSVDSSDAAVEQQEIREEEAAAKAGKKSLRERILGRSKPEPEVEEEKVVDHNLSKSAQRRQQMRDFQAKWRLGTHYAIEHFGMAFTAFVITGIMIVGLCWHNYQKSMQQILGSQAMYNDAFTTSKTNQQGKVTGVYTNADHTKALVMMQFPDPSQISTNAANYQSFLTGTNPSFQLKPLKSEPSGSIYSFGTSGYLGVYMTSAKPFPSQVLSLTMRANKQLVSMAGDAGTDSVTGSSFGASFQKHDQWRVFFNPGASGATHLKALDEATPSVHDIYDQTVTSTSEPAARTKLDDDLQNMQADLSAISDYSNRLTTTSVNGLHVKTPQLPPIIAGDQVTGQAGYGKTPSTLMLKDKVSFANGFDFDWRHGSIEQGYLKNVVPKGQNYVTWLQNKQNATAQSFDASSLKFKMSDGSDLNNLEDSDNNDSGATLDPVTNLTNTANLLSQAYDKYYQDKLSYQVDDMGALLALEVDLNDVTSNNTVNADAKALQTY